MKPKAKLPTPTQDQNGHTRQESEPDASLPRTLVRIPVVQDGGTLDEQNADPPT